ncbi:MAG TPA: gliding motility protein GldC [Puia sp.]|nr:gliding motility protein GldC [Puia sp.]
MKQSTIQIQVALDEQKIPETIHWNASDTSAENLRKAKAFLLSLWDGQEKNALRIDLWTKDMMIDEMEDFFYQTLVTMADTYERATRYNDLADQIRQFARDLFQQSRAKQLKENKLK